MLAGARAPDGSLYVTETAPPDVQFEGGVAVGTQGAIFATSTLPIQSVANGFGVRQNGQLCIAYGGTAKFWQGGLPFTADGQLVCQLNQPESPGDAFVGGIRVGPLGGVYVTDLTPPPFSAFSTGFDQGFA